MQVAIWVAIALLAIVWIFWPSGGARPPILLVVRDHCDEVEGVVRTLRAAGHEVMAIDRGSGDESYAVLRRLTRDGAVSRLSEGEIGEAVLDARVPALVVLRLDERFTGRDALSALRLGR